MAETSYFDVYEHFYEIGRQNSSGLLGHELSLLSNKYGDLFREYLLSATMGYADGSSGVPKPIEINFVAEYVKRWNEKRPR